MSWSASDMLPPGVSPRENEEVKPCPLCGTEPKIEALNVSPRVWGVSCQTDDHFCSATGLTIETAVAIWNRRA